MAGGTSMPNGATVIIAARLLAALYDIHGNLPALDAAIAAAEAARVDCFVIGGDVALGREPIVVCGHTHMQFHRRLDAIQIVNAGSVGMPFGATGAHWLRLGPAIELERTEYDLQSAAARLTGTSYPQAAEFAARSVLHPPSEAEMLAAFEIA